MVWVTGEVITAAKLNAMIDQAYPTLQVLAAMDEATYFGAMSKIGYYSLLTDYLFDDYDLFNDASFNTELWTSTLTSCFSTGYSTYTLEESGGTLNFATSFTYDPAHYNECGISYVVTNQTNTRWYAYIKATSAGTADGTIAQISAIGSETHTYSIPCDDTYRDIAIVLQSGYVIIYINGVIVLSEADVETSLQLRIYLRSGKGSGTSSTSATITVDTTRKTGTTTNYAVTNSGNSGNILTNAISSDAAVLSFFKHLKTLVSNGDSTHATPVQAEIYGNADSYATALNSTKFTIAPADPRIILKRDALDTITASSASQTVWNMTVAGGMPALPNHGTILATLIGVASVLVVEKSVLGDFSDTVVLTENTDYVVDYSTRTATKIILTSGTGIVNAQSKIRISWIADVLKVGATNNTALKLKLYLNRTSSAETSPNIQPIPLGSAKYAELQYCI